MTIQELANKLQKEIDNNMGKFTKLGKKAKELQSTIDKLYVEMASILTELQPVDAILRSQHPDKCELFDQLLELKKK